MSGKEKGRRLAFVVLAAAAAAGVDCGPDAAGGTRVEGRFVRATPALTTPTGTRPNVQRPDSADLLYLVEAGITATSPESLWAEVALVNTTDSTFRIRYGHCALRLRLFAGADTSQVPFHTAGREDEDGNPTACLDYAESASVAPGDTLRLGADRRLHGGEFRVQEPLPRRKLRDAGAGKAVYATVDLTVNGHRQPLGRYHLRVKDP